MVARQVDLGTYAGQSFVLGHDKGRLVAIAQIEQVGKTARVMARKELGVTRVADLRGMRIGNQAGSSTGNTFVDIIAARAGLKKGDYQEIEMNVNEMVAAAAARSIDAFVTVELPAADGGRAPRGEEDRRRPRLESGAPAAVHGARPHLTPIGEHRVGPEPL